MTGRRTFPSVPELRKMPAGERGPRLRALIAFHAARIEGAAPAVQAMHRTMIRKVQAVGRLVGVTDLTERNTFRTALFGRCLQDTHDDEPNNFI